LLLGDRRRIGFLTRLSPLEQANCTVPLLAQAVCFDRPTLPFGVVHGWIERDDSPADAARPPAAFHATLLVWRFTVKVPDEIAEQAKARGMQVEAYVEDILAQRAAAQPSAEHPRTPAQIRAWLDSLAQFSDKIPPLPETISREWIYQDHD
jgi:hypothetical protein